MLDPAGPYLRPRLEALSQQRTARLFPSLQSRSSVFLGGGGARNASQTASVAGLCASDAVWETESGRPAGGGAVEQGPFCSSTMGECFPSVYASPWKHYVWCHVRRWKAWFYCLIGRSDTGFLDTGETWTVNRQLWQLRICSHLILMMHKVKDGRAACEGQPRPRLRRVCAAQLHRRIVHTWIESVCCSP